MKKNRAFIEVTQPRDSTIELTLRDSNQHIVRVVYVYPPTRWEKWLGVAWEDKVVKAFTKLDKQRIETDRRFDEGTQIVDRLGTDLGKQP